MKGNNQLRLCRSAIMEGVEYWLNAEFLREPVCVLGIVEGQGAIFIVTIKPRAVAIDKGNNELRLSKIVIIDAIDFWLNQEVLSKPTDVADVTELKNDNVFAVDLKGEMPPKSEAA